MPLTRIKIPSTDSSSCEQSIFFNRSDSQTVVVGVFTNIGRYFFNKICSIMRQVCIFYTSINSFLSHIFSNLNIFLLNNPPGVLFLLNIFLFVCVLSYMAIFIQVSDNVGLLENEKWREFLETFSKLELCIVPFITNVSSSSSSTFSSKSSFETARVFKPTPKQIMYTHSIPMVLSLLLTSQFSEHSSYQLSTNMPLKYLGFANENEKTQINVTISFDNNWNYTQCNKKLEAFQSFQTFSQSTKKLNKSPPIPFSSQLFPNSFFSSPPSPLFFSGCQINNIIGCITFSAPINIFPEKKHFKHCKSPAHSSPSLLQPHLPMTSSSDYYAGLNWQLAEINAIYYCRSRTTIKLNFKQFLSTPSFHVIEQPAKLHIKNTVILLLTLIFFSFLYLSFFHHKIN